MKFKPLAAVFGIALFTASCTNGIKEKNFYYWRTTHSLSAVESKALESHHSKKIYLRLCDLENSHRNTASPQNVIQWNDEPVQEVNYVPVVYIKNEVFKNLSLQSGRSKEELTQLADNLLRLVTTSWEYKNLSVTEVQIDCDWTASTAEAFFYFLEELKRVSELTISATIRLHQIKYPEKTGIPPIDYGVLMCYNMGNLKSIEAHNSIFDEKVIQQYLNKPTSYNNIPLAIALPIFNWHLVYQKDEFVGITHVDDSELSKYFEKLDNNRYRCATYSWKNPKIKVNDVVRFESTTEEDLQASMKLLKKNLKTWTGELIFFDLNENSLKNFDNEILD